MNMSDFKGKSFKEINNSIWHRIPVLVDQDLVGVASAIIDSISIEIYEQQQALLKTIELERSQQKKLAIKIAEEFD